MRGPKDGFADAIRAIRTARLMGRPMRRHLVPDAGWHFTYLGGPAAVQDKLKSFVGSEKPVMGDASADTVAKRIASGIPVNRKARYDLKLRDIDETYPRHIRDHRERYAALIATESPPGKA